LLLLCTKNALSKSRHLARWRTHGCKTGLGYLKQTSADCSIGIITGVDVYPANQKVPLCCDT